MTGVVQGSKTRILPEPKCPFCRSKYIMQIKEGLWQCIDCQREFPAPLRESPPPVTVLTDDVPKGKDIPYEQVQKFKR